MARRSKKKQPEAAREAWEDATDPREKVRLYVTAHPAANQAAAIRATKVSRSTVNRVFKQLAESGDLDAKRETFTAAVAAEGVAAEVDRLALENQIAMAGLQRAHVALVTGSSQPIDLLAARHGLKLDEKKREREIDRGGASDVPIYWGQPVAGRRMLPDWRPGEPPLVEWWSHLGSAAFNAYVLPPSHRKLARIPFTPHAGQARVTDALLSGSAKHAVLRLPRRWGKSVWATAFADLIARTPSQWGTTGDGRTPEKATILITGVTHTQLQDIYWESGLVDSFFGGRDDCEVRKADKTVVYKNGATIRWAGADNKGSREGSGYALVIVDEAGLTRELRKFIEGSIRPALMDSGGRLVVIGTPKGAGTEYHEITTEAEKDPKYIVLSGTSVENPYLPLAAIEEAIAGMDPDLARQELFGEWVQFSGGCYRFDERLHVSDEAMYDPALPLDLMFDFNIKFFSVAIGQYHERLQRFVIFGEIQSPDVHHTDEICKLILQSPWGPHMHTGRVRLFGDVSGKRQETSSKAGYTDWAIIEKMLTAGYTEGSQVHRYRLVSHHRESTNPDVIDRVQSVNAALRPGRGPVCFQIHPRCVAARKDLVRQEWDEYTRAPSKKQEKQGIGHMNDAIGYWIYALRPISGVTWGLS